jgi:hypothetical protein
MIAQLLRVELNGPHNAYGGDRNKFHLMGIEDEKEIPKEIDLQLNLGSYVLVKYKDKVFLCERKEGGGYTRLEITYHPYLDKFS